MCDFGVVCGAAVLTCWVGVEICGKMFSLRGRRGKGTDDNLMRLMLPLVSGCLLRLTWSLKHLQTLRFVLLASLRTLLTLVLVWELMRFPIFFFFFDKVHMKFQVSKQSLRSANFYLFTSCINSNYLQSRLYLQVEPLSYIELSRKEICKGIESTSHDLFVF